MSSSLKEEWNHQGIYEKGFDDGFEEGRKDAYKEMTSTLNYIQKTIYGLRERYLPLDINIQDESNEGE